jgi:hypothetical protein
MNATNPEMHRQRSTGALWVPFVLVVGGLAFVLITVFTLLPPAIEGSPPPPVFREVAAVWGAAWFLAYLLLFIQLHRFPLPRNIRTSTWDRIPVRLSTIASATMVLVGYLLIVPSFFARFTGCNPGNGTCYPPASWTFGLLTYTQVFVLGLLVACGGIILLALVSWPLTVGRQRKQASGEGSDLSDVPAGTA